MDRDAAFQYLTDYWALVSQAQKQSWWTKEGRATRDAFNQRLVGVNQILVSLGPDFAQIDAHWLREHLAAWPRLSRALATST